MAYLLLCADRSSCSPYQALGIPALVFLAVFAGGTILVPILFVFHIIAKKQTDLSGKDKNLFIIGALETEVSLWVILILTKMYHTDLQTASWTPLVILGMIATGFLYYNVYKILTPTTLIKNPHQK